MILSPVRLALCVLYVAALVAGPLSAKAGFVDERRARPADAAGTPAPVLAPGSTATAAVTKPAAPAGPAFDVRLADRSVREVLARWAKSAGWTHEPVHWTLDRDHPVQAAADASQFSGDFRTAARQLLASTEYGDAPAQPCFYTNRVVRVIPKAEHCNRPGVVQPATARPAE